MTKPRPEFVPAGAAIGAGNVSIAADKVRAWWKKARRNYPEATLRACRFDWAGISGLLPTAGCIAVAGSVRDRRRVYPVLRRGRRKACQRAPISRDDCDIATAHRAAKLMKPNDDEDVKFALNSLHKPSPKRQKQAKALGWHDIKRFLITAVDDIRADREGSLAYLSPDTVGYLQAWLAAAKITHGAVFRRLIGKGRIGDRLQTDAIAQTFKRVAEFVGMTPEEAKEVSGHSIRAGATQEMLALNIDLASVMQAGRWKTTVMPMRYGEEVQAGAGGWRGRRRRRGGLSDYHSSELEWGNRAISLICGQPEGGGCRRRT